MKISDSLADLIATLAPQIQSKFNIKIGYSCPQGCFISDEDDFILYKMNDINYLIEYNPEDDNSTYSEDIKETESKENVVFFDLSQFLSGYKPSNLDEETDKIKLFCKKLDEWIANEDIIIYEDRYFKHYKWSPVGNGKFSVVAKKDNCEMSWHKTLDEFPKEYTDLKEHILQEMKNE